MEPSSLSESTIAGFSRYNMLPSKSETIEKCHNTSQLTRAALNTAASSMLATQLKENCLSPNQLTRPSLSTAGSGALSAQLIEEKTCKVAEICFSEHDKCKNTLVLDLVGTLLCISKKKTIRNSRELKVSMAEERHTAYLIMRPGAEEFLREHSKFYNICVCSTAGINVIKEMVSVSGISKYVQKIITRENSSDYDSLFIKDVGKLGYDPSRTILIDDSFRHVQSQPDNGIKIKTFEGDTKDNELHFVGLFCKHMANWKEIRPVVANMFDFFQARKLDLKESALLSSNQVLLDQLNTDDLEEDQPPRQQVKALNSPLESTKSNIDRKMSAISLFGVASEKLPTVIGEERNLVQGTIFQKDIRLDSKVSNTKNFLLTFIQQERMRTEDVSGL